MPNLSSRSVQTPSRAAARRMDVHSALATGSGFDDLNTVIRDTCRRFQLTTGWPLVYERCTPDLAAIIEEQLQKDEGCHWFQAISAGPSPVGMLSLSRHPAGTLSGPKYATRQSSEKRLRKLAFPLNQACDSAAIVARLLTQVATSHYRLRLQASSQTDADGRASGEDLHGRLATLALLGGFDAAALIVPKTANAELEIVAAVGLETDRFDCSLLVSGSVDDVVAMGPDSVPARFEIGLRVPLKRRGVIIGHAVLFQQSDTPIGAARLERVVELSEQFAAAIDDRAIALITTKNREVNKELRMLQCIQQATERNARVLDDTLDLAAISLALSEVNGDLCEIIPIDESRTLIAVGDACGHGLPAAVVTTTVQGCLRCLVHDSDFDPDPAAILTTISSALHSSTPSFMFMSLLVGVLDSQRNKFRYASAGHPSPIVLSGIGKTTLLQGSGMLLGVMEDTEYTNQCAETESGDLLIAFTDGISESRNEDKDLFQVEGIVRALETVRGESASDIAAAIHECANNHAANGLQDDATVVAIKRLFDVVIPE